MTLDLKNFQSKIITAPTSTTQKSSPDVFLSKITVNAFTGAKNSNSNSLWCVYRKLFDDVAGLWNKKYQPVEECVHGTELTE